MILLIPCFMLLVPAVLITAYTMGLAVYALIRNRNEAPEPARDPLHTFVIIIPAHNEEKEIAETLVSCKAIDYPGDMFDIYVIADNCTDSTAGIARAFNVHCLERVSDDERGKGFALSWAYEKISTEGHDAVVVLDADCAIETQALRVFDRHLSAGHLIMQANCSVANPETNPQSFIFALGNTLENLMYYLPKSSLGLAVFLQGTGMAFARSILKTYPWSAHSIVEDMEYSLRLLRGGERIWYVGNIQVLTGAPVGRDQLFVQRTRWASGTLSFSKKNSLRLILEGIGKKSLPLADAGWTMITLSRPLILALVFLVMVLSALSWVIMRRAIARSFFAVSLATALMQCVYFGIGLMKMGVNSRRLRLLLQSPGTILQLIRISLEGLLFSQKNEWERTPR